MNNQQIPTGAAELLPDELVRLGSLIAALPPTHRCEIQVLHDQLVRKVASRRKILSLVQEAMTQLRLEIKYLMFDLDVTRHERDELRQALDEGS